MQVIVVIDDSEDSSRAIGEVRQREWPAGAKILVLAVVRRRFIPPPPQPMLSVVRGEPRRANEASHARVLVQLTAASLRESGLEVEGKVRWGRAHREIVREARERAADLIVIGAARLSAPRRWLRGGEQASRVVAGAPCSVDVIRPREEPTLRGEVNGPGRRYYLPRTLRRRQALGGS